MLEEECKELFNILILIDPKNIYNGDELGLFRRLQLKKMYIYNGKYVNSEKKAEGEL